MFAHLGDSIHESENLHLSLIDLSTCYDNKIVAGVSKTLLGFDD